MKIISVDKDINGAPLPNTSSWIIDDNIPPFELISSVFGLILDAKDNILLVKNTKRGWYLPGGHVEKGESLEEALNREVKEETECEIEIIKPFGYMKIESQGIKPQDYKYPHPIGYVQYYLAKLKKINEFDLSSVWRTETQERKLSSLEEAGQIERIKEKLLFFKEGISQYPR